MPRRRQPTIALMLAAIGLTLPANALADCLVYEEPPACEMMWTVDEGFWIGDYSVRVGPLHMTAGGQPMSPPEPPPPERVQVFQIGTSLVIDSPFIGSATLQPVGLDAEPWEWDSAYAEEMGVIGLSDIELVNDCSNAELPRWIAPVENPNPGPETQLEIVAIGPRHLLMHLSIPGQPVMFQGINVTLNRRIFLERDSFPIENLEPTAYSAEDCDTLCPSPGFHCPERE